MGLVETAQLIGTVSVLILFIIQFYVSIDLKAFIRIGRTTLFWTSVYILFLFIARLINYSNITSSDNLRIISGFGALIPLIATSVQFFLSRNMGNETTPK